MCCDKRILCQVVVVLKVFSVLVHGYGNYSSDPSYYHNLGENVHMEHVLRNFLATSASKSRSSSSSTSNSDTKRESRFVHYDTSDNAVNFGIEFTVPFLNIPVKKTVDTAMGFLQVIPRTSLNLNALFIGLLLMVGIVMANSLIDKTSPPLQTLMKMAQSAMSGSEMKKDEGDEENV